MFRDARDSLSWRMEIVGIGCCLVAPAGEFQKMYCTGKWKFLLPGVRLFIPAPALPRFSAFFLAMESLPDVAIDFDDRGCLCDKKT